MDRRSVLKLAAGAAATAPLSAINLRRAIAQGAAGRPITYGQSTSLTALDPGQGGFLNYPAGYEAALCIYDRLIDFDADMKIVPQLATSYTMSADLKSCELKLRAGLKAHDGTSYDAAAVKLNLERMMDKAAQPDQPAAMGSDRRDRTPDASTIVIATRRHRSRSSQHAGPCDRALSSPAALEKFGDTGIAQNPVGSGPFKVGFNPGQELTLEAFDGYWGGKPATPRITFQFIAEPATRINALTTGAVQVIDNVPVQLVQQIQRAECGGHHRPGLRPMGLAINLTRGPLVRQCARASGDQPRRAVATIAERVFFGFREAPDSPLAFDAIDYKKVAPWRSTKRRRRNCSPPPVTNMVRTARLPRTARR